MMSGLRLVCCVYCKKLLPLKCNFYFYDKRHPRIGVCVRCKDLYKKGDYGIFESDGHEKSDN